VQLAGVDSCPAGWLVVTQLPGLTPEAFVCRTASDIVERLHPDARIAIDIPIGLPEAGLRDCDLQARQLLGYPRMSSVFHAPIRPVLEAADYRTACAIRYRVEGKKMSQQAFHIIPKIREMDALLQRNPLLNSRMVEVHPEVSFAQWNGGVVFKNGKKTPAGRSERRDLIEQRWPGIVDRLRRELKGNAYNLDDLHDALAALWTAGRWTDGDAFELGSPQARDENQLPMRIVV
jgi:predicted RNase H-like nuclease